MALPLQLENIEDLARTPASDVKKLGWRGVMKSVGRRGKVVVTNHDTPEAVILSTAEYEAILRALEAAGAPETAALEALRKRFDERLSVLDDANAGDRARALLRKPGRLHGRQRTGSSH